VTVLSLGLPATPTRRGTREGSAGALLLAAALSLPACGDPPRTLRDTEGRSFAAECTRKEGCSVAQRGGPKWPGAGSAPEVQLRTASRVVAVCNVAPGGGEPHPGECRALTCRSAADCPPAHGTDQGTCLGGICTDESLPITPADATALCLAGTGLGRDSPGQLERAAMGQACGTPCVVPAVCRQP